VAPLAAAQEDAVARLLHVLENLVATMHSLGPEPPPPSPTPAAAVAAAAPLLPGQGAPAPGGPTARQMQLMEMQAQIQAELGAWLSKAAVYQHRVFEVRRNS